MGKKRPFAAQVPLAAADEYTRRRQSPMLIHERRNFLSAPRGLSEGRRASFRNPRSLARSFPRSGLPKFWIDSARGSIYREFSLCGFDCNLIAGD